MLEKVHLLIIREVDRTGTVTEAAKSLFLTQSALSHAIKKLELQLGVEVWRKEGRTLRLTQAGDYLLQVANRVLPQFEHAEAVMQQFARGERGTLRIGMECHPCYIWLQKVVPSFLNAWPDVDVDIKQEFQFGGIAALFNFDIDALVTPDPLFKSGLVFESVFNYELVLAVSSEHPIAKKHWIIPEDLRNEILITYPVPTERLDIYNQFFIPAGTAPKMRKTVEATEMMLQLVAAGRGVSALPGWLVKQYREKLPLSTCRLGKAGIFKNIYLGIRSADQEIDYIKDFVNKASMNGSYAYIL